MALRENAQRQHLLQVLHHIFFTFACAAGQLCHFSVYPVVAQLQIALRPLQPLFLADSEADHAVEEEQEQEIHDPSAQGGIPCQEDEQPDESHYPCDAQADSAEHLIEHVGDAAHFLDLDGG